MKIKNLNLDEIDVKILKNLQKNARLTVKELAAKLFLTPTPVYERIKRLEKNGYITAYVAILNARKLNRSVMVVINLTIKEHSQEQREIMIKQLKGFDEISEILNTAGSYDYMAKGRFESVDTYRDFLVNKLSTISNISDVDSHIVLEVLKSSTEVHFN